MAHDHQHAHGVGPETQSSALKTALILIVAFMAAEVVTGILASSLALLSDAAHMPRDRRTAR
jgi:cobalt-zinc-cadmium efflux system protein